jgi:hypothetical protein
MLWFRRLVIAAISLALASGLIVLARRAADFATIGDTAVIESYTWMASTGDLLLGPYSRFQWHHPGPLSFFWIAPFYALSGARPAGLSAGALTLNLTVLAILTSTLIRRADVILSVSIMAVVASYCWRIAPVLTSPWNPHLIVLAMMALIVAAADVLAGSYARLPVVALLASLVGQTHVGLVPSALAIGGVSVIVSTAGSWRQGRRNEIVRALLATVAVLALLWALPIAQQLTDSPGNMTELWRFFVSQSHPGQRWASAFSAWSDMLTGLVRPDFAVATGLRFRQSPIRWVEAFAVLQLAALAATAALAARARRRFELSLALLLLMVSLLALWSATRIEQTIFDHEVFWISGVGALNIAVLLSFALRSVRIRVQRGVRSETTASSAGAAGGGPLNWPATVVCLMLLTACAAIGLREMFATVAAASNPSPESETVSAVAKELESYLERERIVRPLVLIDQDAWPLAAGVILRLQKNGVPVAVEDDWIPMFTPLFAATGREAAELAIDGKAQHVRSLGKPGDVVIIEHDPQLFVHRILSR